MGDALPLTYTDVDVPANRLTLTANSFDFTQYSREEIVYGYKDYGVDNFGDIVHEGTVIFDNSSNLFGGGLSYPFCFWALTNDLGTERVLAAAGKSFLVIEVATNGVNNFISLRERDGGTNYQDAKILSLGLFTYYYTITITGTAYSADFYNDAGKTSFAFTLSLTRHNTDKYKNHYGFMGIGSGVAGNWSSGHSQDISGTGFPIGFQAAWARNSNQVIGMPQ